jgi:cardiolipin synthase
MDLKRLLGVVTLANQLTFLRLVAVPFFTLAVLGARFGVALALFVAAAITDLLDGLTARMLRQRTPLGAYLDPAADKLLLVSAFILLTDYPAMFQDIPMVARLPIWLSILAISRDILIVAVALMMYLAYGRTHFEPTLWGKLTTASEALTIGLFLLANAVGVAHPVLEVAVWVTLGLILVSGFHYLFRTGRSERREGPDRSPPA